MSFTKANEIIHPVSVKPKYTSNHKKSAIRQTVALSDLHKHCDICPDVHARVEVTSFSYLP